VVTVAEFVLLGKGSGREVRDAPEGNRAQGCSVRGAVDVLSGRPVALDGILSKKVQGNKVIRRLNGLPGLS
jgi:hypothetical protein